MHSGARGRRKGTRQFKSHHASRTPKAKELKVSGISGVRFRGGYE